MTDLRGRLQEALADRYRLERELGRGGMATVYLATDLRHKRPVALKVLHPELAQTLGPERFQREIETAARLQHPHILTVHDSGEAAGQLWYTMPYVEGESLRDRLRRETQLGLEDALRLTAEVADALEYAHSQGVVHRDIKPENILLSRGHALVADFGIARALSEGGEHLTQTGMSVGTPAYMSPEQAGGEHQNLDGRSDLYSLACVVYEMVAGEPPHSGPTPQAILAKRLLGPAPDLRRARPNVPASVADAVTRALATVPGDRFPSVAEFARALQLSSTGPITGPAVPLGAVGGGRRRRVPVAAATLGLGILIGLGVLFAWRRSRPGAGETNGPKVLVVLPFENLGDSSQAYFADGVSDEVRGKLSQLAGLTVIARASSNQYRRTNKPQQQIARELGAKYLLTATVRWDKQPDGTSRVRVSPELVWVVPGAAPRTKWQQGFDAPLTDVFQVQADIAGLVAQALNVALGESTKRELATKPTQNLSAYDAFLRGEAASRGMSEWGPASLRPAIAAYEQAVKLDSTFAPAWAQLARAQSVLYFSGTPSSSVAEAARRAADRAVALSPTRSEGHQALAAYYSNVLRDHRRAYTEDSTALAVAPNNAEVLGAVGFDELSLGNWDAGRRHLERAVRLDPRASLPAANLAYLLLFTRDYPEAARASDRALQLVPANLDVRECRAMVELAQGDLAGARLVLKSAPKEIDPAALTAYVAQYWDLLWVLDEAQLEQLDGLKPNAFDDNRVTWGVVLAQVYGLQGNGVKARAYADSARLATGRLQVAEQDAQSHVSLGLALAYLGQRAAAIREGERAIALLPVGRDAFQGPYVQHQLVRIYLLVGEPEKALDQLEPLLKIPYYLSPGWLKIDPNFDQLRGNPRFQRLVEGKP